MVCFKNELSKKKFHGNYFFLLLTNNVGNNSTRYRLNANFGFSCIHIKYDCKRILKYPAFMLEFDFFCLGKSNGIVDFISSLCIIKKF